MDKDYDDVDLNKMLLCKCLQDIQVYTRLTRFWTDKYDKEMDQKPKNFTEQHDQRLRLMSICHMRDSCYTDAHRAHERFVKLKANLGDNITNDILKEYTQ